VIQQFASLGIARTTVQMHLQTLFCVCFAEMFFCSEIGILHVLRTNYLLYERAVCKTAEVNKLMNTRSNALRSVTYHGFAMFQDVLKHDTEFCKCANCSSSSGVRVYLQGRKILFQYIVPKVKKKGPLNGRKIEWKMRHATGTTVERVALASAQECMHQVIQTFYVNTGKQTYSHAVAKAKPRTRARRAGP
jgi:hypothetical protein